MFWDPAICRAVIPGVAVAFRSTRDPSSFRVRDLDGHVFVLRDPAGIDHVLMMRGGRRVQLAVRGAGVLRPVHLLTDLTLPDGARAARLAAIADFHALCRSGSGHRDPASDAPSSNRLRVILQALDGYLAGASQRDIAAALFGPSRVRCDWRDAGGHLRDRVRRAIRRGRALMASDYLTLLR